MRVSAIVGVEKNDKFTRELVEIPEGSWAVILQVQTNLNEDLGALGENYVYRSESTKVGFSGGFPSEIVIKRFQRGDHLLETKVFWSSEPFVLFESWESPISGRWVHLARRVSRFGLSKTYPQFRLPTFQTCQIDPRPTKWCRLVELADLVGVAPASLISFHLKQFEGYDSGLHIIRAIDATELTNATTYQVAQSANTLLELEKDLDVIWVRLRFAQVVMFLNMLGWHKRIRTGVLCHP